ncbi:MAG TPA: hypothetical protein VF322_15415 [Gammaproteobacteria bacterium]
MKYARELLVSTVVGGFLVVLPIYLTLLLLLKAMELVVDMVRPLTVLLPESTAAEGVLSLGVVLLGCAMIGLAVRTATGRAVRERVERSLFGHLPSYGLFRSLTQQLAGRVDEGVWKPALVEIEEALVPAFIVEVLADGRHTVFVPSAPTPLAGSIYILTPERVHPIDVAFTRALRCVFEWGAGAQQLVGAMRSEAQR